MTQPPLPSRSGIAALIGRANAGKSTLLNRMVEEKVAIVSGTAQTTRNLIRAVLTDPRGQIVFLDTPGIHRAKEPLGRRMNKIARNAADGVDAALLIVDASAPPAMEDEGWIRRLLFSESHVLVVLNKDDLGGRHARAYRDCWERVAEEKGRDRRAEWHTVSALTGAGIPELMERLFELMPAGPLLFPPDVLTDYPRKLNIGDLIREQFFRRLREEVPHALAVRVENIEETDAGGGWNISATVYVDRHSQKGIVIGHKGRLIKKVREEARREVRKMYDRPVALELRVKVEPKWRENYWILRELGYA
ncbi:GTPase Era [Kiritimatiella glycovorans]|uniref:GTPase Era n=1 Tax=Kiritimatiella glycovorans TaxID=1307763 RepID=A0A0G3EIJ4_9BACT|nr:GTPase Era [Kiritimatiella glycovorans]AKJ64635.1 Bex protein [Kiritimatiella glycovorans]